MDSAEESSHFPQAGRSSSNDTRVQFIYWRCVAVFFAVIRQAMGKSYELRLYTNCAADLPEAPSSVRNLLQELDVWVISLPIKHCPPKSFTKRFRNQFYILDVLKFIAGESVNRGHLVLDSDCVCLRPLGKLFEDLQKAGALTLQEDSAPDADINGLTRRQLGQLCGELGVPLQEIPFYFGGEFFAATGDMARRMVIVAEKAYEESLRRHENGMMKFTEEAHLLSFVYYALNIDASGTANPYIKRLWTGVHYRNGVEADRQLPIVHLPSEKRFGYVKLFDDILNRESWFYTIPYGEKWIGTAQKVLSIPRPGLMKMTREIAVYATALFNRTFGIDRQP